jgi:hypothetical protein
MGRAKASEKNLILAFAFAEAARVKGDGDEDPVLAGGDARVVEGVEEERG